MACLDAVKICAAGYQAYLEMSHWLDALPCFSRVLKSLKYTGFRLSKSPDAV